MDLHDPDCPMTNERPEDRTGCICDASMYAQEDGSHRTVPEGGGPRIVAAFPATGKTWVAENMPGVIDSDSSAFSWTHPGSRERHPDWPGNYIAHIRGLLRATSVRYVLVSTHREVRAALYAHGLPFLLVYPVVGLREEYRGRMVRRGTPATSTAKVIELWTPALEECERQQGCTKRRLAGGEHLADVLCPMCPTCDGEGIIDEGDGYGADSPDCSACGGSGWA